MKTANVKIGETAEEEPGISSEYAIWFQDTFTSDVVDKMHDFRDISTALPSQRRSHDVQADNDQPIISQ